MPLPLAMAVVILATSVTSGGIGVNKILGAHRTNTRAEEIRRQAETVIRNAQQQVNHKLMATKWAIETLGQTKVRILSTTFNTFVHDFSKLKKVELKTSPGIRELQRLYGIQTPISDIPQRLQRNSRQMQTLAKHGLAGIGGGTALAMGAYGTVGVFGTASTGAAISGLSGAAATNATLAWLGGGSLAAGGLGVAGGTAVLGGLIAGPALAIFGCLGASKARTNLNNACSEAIKSEVSRLNQQTIIERLHIIEDRAKQLNDVLVQLNFIFSRQVRKMQYTIRWNGTDWETYGPEEKKTIEMCLITAMGIKKIIDASLLTKDGSLAVGTQQAIQKGRQLIRNIH